MGRCHRAIVALPGGDAIGSRPLDMHQAGLRALGARMDIEHGAVVGEADALIGAEITLEFPSVGATENILMAAVLAKGTTVIDNAAREPEITDVVLMLGQMGAIISGAGTSTLTIEGVDRLYPTEHRTVGDRVVGGTWAYAAAITRGSIDVRGVDSRPPVRAARTVGPGRSRHRRHPGRFHRATWPTGRRRSTSSRCRTRASRPTCSRWRWRWPRSPTATR